MGDWHLDPVKTQQFVKGFKEGNPDAPHATKVLALGIGASLLVPNPGWPITNVAVGMTLATAYLVYEKLSKEGYKGGK